MSYKIAENDSPYLHKCPREQGKGTLFRNTKDIDNRNNSALGSRRVSIY